VLCLVQEIKRAQKRKERLTAAKLSGEHPNAVMVA